MRAVGLRVVVVFVAGLVSGMIVAACSSDEIATLPLAEPTSVPTSTPTSQPSPMVSSSSAHAVPWCLLPTATAGCGPIGADDHPDGSNGHADCFANVDTD